jgi:hypothetical protein
VVGPQKSVRWPDFYIVGAPRCGTTFMWHYLRSHPDVFLPADKERPFFCHDLLTGTAMDSKHSVDEAGFHARFEGATGLVGEACAYDLFSSVAAAEIHARRPDARILIFTREPEAQIKSWHHVRTFLGVEDLDLESALAAEPARARGEQLPRNAYLVPMYQYRAVASYDEQIERYLRAFGEEQVAIFPLEQTRADSAVAYRRATSFLGLRDWSPQEFEVVGPSYPIRHRTLLRVLTDERLISTAKKVVPRPLHPAARRVSIELHRRVRPRRPGRRADD